MTYLAPFLAVFLGAASPEQGNILFQENFEGGFSHAWQPVKFEGQTTYAILREGENSYLVGQADKTASGLGVKFDPPLSPYAAFSWKWRIDQIPPGGSDDSKRTFDHTARLFVAFKTFLGPPRTINYVWGNREKVGAVFRHPTSGRARFIVLQSGNGKAGQWLAESRDLAADWKLLFGGDDPPEIVGLGLMTDADGTEALVTGGYDDLKLIQKR